ncbi:MAG: hypothetical protein MP439_05375 [Ferrimicrobium sp.]|jgi:hypothetical protein|nr:hypothetical protein [Ferrimicrobium sp.]
MVRSEGFRELFSLRTNAIGFRGERAPHRLQEHQRGANPEEHAFATVRGLVGTHPVAVGVDQSGSEALGSIALDDEPTLAPTPIVALLPTCVMILTYRYLGLDTCD